MADQSQWQKAFRYASIGMELIVFFLLLMAGGMWLDGRLGTRPLFALVGAAAGFALGMYRMVVDLRKEERRSRKDREGPDRMS